MNTFTRYSIRLPDYDYSQNGAYFITICTQNRVCLFGEIPNVGADLRVCPKMKLNDAGQMIQKWWLELENKFQNIFLDEYMIMPNHLHGIIVIDNNSNISMGEHAGSPLPKMIQWFKTMTTNAYINGVNSNKFPPFQKRIWQRNYYEHVIRNEHSLNAIREYIRDNPTQWESDENNPNNP